MQGISVGFIFLFLDEAFYFAFINSNLMKTKNIVIALLILVFLQSCARAISPYQAANNPRGRHCKVIGR